MTALSGTELRERARVMRIVALKYLSEDTPITVRRLHYLLVSDPDAVGAGYENSHECYRSLDKRMKEAHERNPWEEEYISPLCFVDETRTTVAQSGWSSLSEFANAYSQSFDYDMWQNQPRIVEVLIEKDGVLSVLRPICSEHQVYLRSLHGQSSITLACDVAKRFADAWLKGKTCTVLYGGDHDPSGYCIEESMRSKIAEYADRCFQSEIEIDWRRWALLEDDFAKHGIASLDPKEDDKNLPAFYARFGSEAQFAEMDSLPTDELQKRVDDAIIECKDAAIWQEDFIRVQIRRLTIFPH
jgi:hypothetical protein